VTKVNGRQNTKVRQERNSLVLLGVLAANSIPRGAGYNPAAMQRQTCHFSGRVQGVGFRYTVQNIALQYDVQGFVRNLDDGRVELVMEGPDDQVQQMLQNVQSRMQPYIEDVEAQSSAATGEFGHFSIRH
jgi:acylphosphatase